MSRFVRRGTVSKGSGPSECCLARQRGVTIKETCSLMICVRSSASSLPDPVSYVY